MIEVKAISVQFDASLARVTLNPPKKTRLDTEISTRVNVIIYIFM